MIKFILVFARLITILLVCGIFYGLHYLNNLYSGFTPILWGIFYICVCLTVIAIILNVIITILVENYFSKES